jgi:hypothetical protein
MKYLDIDKFQRSRHSLETWLEAIAELTMNAGKLGSELTKLGFEHPLLPEYPRCPRIDILRVKVGVHRVCYKGGNTHKGACSEAEQKRSHCPWKVIGYGEPTWRAMYAGFSPIYDYAAESERKPGYFSASSENWIQDGDFKFREGTIVVTIGSEHPCAVQAIFYCVSDKQLSEAELAVLQKRTS